MTQTGKDASETPVKWLKVTLQTPSLLSEAAEDLMGVLSGSAVEQTPVTETDCTITGFFQLEDDSTINDQVQTVTEMVQSKMTELFSLYEQEAAPLATEIMDDQQWATSWQQFFSAFEIIPGLVIKPSWEEYIAETGQIVVEMDPGMAFGTGQHASTQMALSLLAECTTSETASVLDVGTGTGILAMTGCLLGARQAVAIDNDPDAVKAAGENAAKNGLESKIGVSGTPLEKVEGHFPVICANIIHDVLVEMAPRLTELIEAQGYLVLAGILRGEQEKNIIKVYGEKGFSLIKTEHQEEWAGLLLQHVN